MPLLRDWTDSRTVDALCAHGERFFVRLLMKVDDYGRTDADPRLLKSRLFPLKADIRETDISRWLAACQMAGLLRFYADGKGRKILEVFKFGQRKRFMKSEFDPPEGQQNFLLPPKEVEVEGKGRKQRDAAPPLDKKPAAPDSRAAHGQAGGQRSEVRGQRSERTPVRLALWQLLADEKNIRDRLKSERESTKPDAEMIEALKLKLKAVREEMKSSPTNS